MLTLALPWSLVCAVEPPPVDVYTTLAAGSGTYFIALNNGTKLTGSTTSFLLRIKTNGAIEYVQRLTSEDVQFVHDYRPFKKGQKTFFLTDHIGPEAIGLCKQLADERVEPCFRVDYLDSHELISYPNGDFLVFLYQPRPNSVGLFKKGILDLVIRRYSLSHKLVWEWSSNGHLDPNDSVANVDETFLRYTISLARHFFAYLLDSFGVKLPYRLPLIGKAVDYSYNDYVHGNSIETDDDGGLIVSARHLNQIIKISYPDGKIVWTLGGYRAKRSDFKIVDDPLGGFSHQHSVRRLPNGHLLLFDNGNLKPKRVSRAAEYSIHMKAREAQLVWEYRAKGGDEALFRFAMGSTQRLPNGNTVIGWGAHEPLEGNTSAPVVTEVTREGKKVFEVRALGDLMSYRAWKQLDKEVSKP